MPEHIDMTRVIVYTAGAVGWALVGYASNVYEDDDVDLDALKAGKTIAVGFVAGLIMAYGGDEFNHEAFLAAAAIAIPIVDRAINTLAGMRAAAADSTDRLE